jgi:hypothetical protein
MTLQSRLGAITQALNRGDFATAMIAAVHTQTPVLTAEAAARLAQADRELTKYDYNPEESRDWHGRWTADGSSAPAAPTIPAIDADQRTARADTPPLRVAENPIPSDGAIASDAPAPSGGNSSRAAAPSGDSGKQTALLQSFKEKYDGLGPTDFSDQAIRFGYWLEAHGRELTGEEREKALAEYFFLENRIQSRLSDENNSILEHGYLYSAALMLHRGGAGSGLVPVGHFPPSILDVAGTTALLETPSRSGQTDRRPLTAFPKPSGNAGRGSANEDAVADAPRTKEIKQPNTPDGTGEVAAEKSPATDAVVTAINGAAPDLAYPRGFQNAEQFAQAMNELRSILRDAGITDAQIGVRGSSVTGVSYRTGDPFRQTTDPGPPVVYASDIDFFVESNQLTNGLETSRKGFVYPGDLQKAYSGIAGWAETWTANLGRKVSVGGWQTGRLPHDPALIGK